MLTVAAEDVAEGDRLFASHGQWMKGHPRDGDLALLDYTVSKGPELSNPFDRAGADRQDDFVIDEYYESPAGIANHWQDSADNFPENVRPCWNGVVRPPWRHCTTARLSRAAL